MASSTSAVTTSNMKVHLRVDTTNEDDYIDSLILAATDYCKDFQRRDYLNTTHTEKYDSFPDNNEAIILPRAPLSSITHIKYQDTGDTQQTLSSDNYVVDTYNEPGRIALAYGETWPSTYLEINTVEIKYVAGYGSDSDSVPDDIKHLVKLMVAHLYENREATLIGTIVAELPFAVRTLLWNKRVPVNIL